MQKKQIIAERNSEIFFISETKWITTVQIMSKVRI